MANTRTGTRGLAHAGGGSASALAQRKLRAFARIEAEFRASFRFVEEVHGQRAFSAFAVASAVRYLHALYICECKDRLLSVPHSAGRYEGIRALELLRAWQAGESADVIAFIHRRLDDQPFAELTRRLEDARRMGDEASAARLTSGRAVLLNRLVTLAHAFAAIFALEPEELRLAVRAECAGLGHTPAQIVRQLASLRGDLYRYAPEPALARRNMLLMNAAGLGMSDTDGERPGERTDRVQPGSAPAAPYAAAPIANAQTQVSLRWRADRVSPLFPAPSGVEPDQQIAQSG